jgi:hypothetical protein
VSDSAKRDAGKIYKAAADRVGGGHQSQVENDLLIVECILRAMLEVMTPEQRACVLLKVQGQVP